MAALALGNKGVRLGELGRLEEEIAVQEDIGRRYGEATEPGLRVAVARALVNKGWALGELGRFDEEISVYDVADRRFRDAAERGDEDFRGDFCELLARALVSKGLALGELGRADEAIAAYEEADRRFGDECVAELASLASIGLIDLREQAARALVNKAETLLRLERPGDAIAACEEFGERFGDDIEPEFGERITIVRDRSRPRAR
jgi:tetratricopeptide (TPR) repeat protein